VLDGSAPNSEKGKKKRAGVRGAFKKNRLGIRESNLRAFVNSQIPITKKRRVDTHKQRQKRARNVNLTRIRQGNHQLGRETVRNDYVRVFVFDRAFVVRGRAVE
jgi:hypothetical protein